MDIDIEWVKDDLRDRPNERAELFNMFKNALIENNKNFMIVSGNFKKRIKTSIEFIDNFLYLQNYN